MVYAAWLKTPPTGSVWLVEDTLTNLVRIGVDIGGPVQSETFRLLNQGQTVLDDERLWSSVPAQVGITTREALRTKLRSALDACRGFN